MAVVSPGNILREEFPDNSHKSKELKHVDRPVVTGKIIEKKKPLARKFASTFINEDIGSVKEYILFDLLIPGIRDTIYDIINKGAEMLIYPKGRPSNKRISSYGGTYVSYNNYSKSSSMRPSESYRGRSSCDFNDIIIESRQEAESVIDTLIDIIERYGQATVTDLYDCLNISRNNYTDSNFGWKDLRGAKIVPVRHGYMLDLPRPIEVD